MKDQHSMTVAVLPFVNVSDDPRIDTMGEAIGNAVRTMLQGAGAVHATRHAVNSTGDRDVHLSHLADDLHADALLFGCVCLRDGVLQAKVQVVDARTGIAVWAARTAVPVHGSAPEELAEWIAADLEREVPVVA